MKGKKKAIALQERLQKVVWPKHSEGMTHFKTFNYELKTLVFENLHALPSGGVREAMASWGYDEDGEEFFFTASDVLTLETKPGAFRRCNVSTMFVLPRAWLSDVMLAIEMLNDTVLEWRKALIAVRKLQLQHILATEGQEAFLAATERS